MALIIKIEMLTILAYCIFNMVVALYMIIKEKSIIKLIDDKFDKRIIKDDVIPYDLSIKDKVLKFIIIFLTLPNVIVMKLVEAVMKTNKSSQDCFNVEGWQSEFPNAHIEGYSTTSDSYSHTEGYYSRKEEIQNEN